MIEDCGRYNRENLDRYYEEQSAGVYDEPMEEPYYYLCEGCNNNNGLGRCSKSSFPIRMCYRKRKCKNYDQWIWNREEQLRDVDYG